MKWNATTPSCYSQIKSMLMKRIISQGWIILLLLVGAPPASGQTRVLFSTKILDIPCLIRVVGASQQEIFLNGTAQEVSAKLVPGQTYRLKMMFGRTGKFTYAITDAFTMAEVTAGEDARIILRKDDMQLLVKENHSTSKVTVLKNGLVQVGSWEQKISADNVFSRATSTIEEFGQDRVWTDISGKQVRGCFMQRDATNVVLLGASKQLFTIPIERFADADRAYLASLPSLPATK
jgi:hypothetical protein